MNIVEFELVYIYNFISPSQHGSITVIKKKKIINTNKQQYWKKEKNDILILHNQCDVWTTLSGFLYYLLNYFTDCEY